MKYLVYSVAFLLALILFLPTSGTTKIRNLPLLIAIVLLFVAFALYRVLKYIFLMSKAKKTLKQKGFRCEKVTILPFASMLRGRYSINMKRSDKKAKITFLVTKRKYQHYYFETINLLKFYSTNRVVFNNIKAKGATISDLVETKELGKQKCFWNSDDLTQNDSNILLFNKLPKKISDSIKHEELENGDNICDTNVKIYDLDGFKKYVNTL